MKAVVQRKYGGVDELELTQVETPTIKDNEMLIEMYSVNIASGDMRVNTLDVPTMLKPILRLVFGWNGPRNIVRGISGAGKVKEIGSKITNFSVNDDVYFINSMKAGCLADYIVLNEKSKVVKMPKNMSYTEAAPVSFGAMSAYHFINENTITKGMKVLIYGASGSVGSYAVQLAKYYGAEITGVSSKKNHDVLRSIGANHTIDYKTTDFTTTSKKYDVIFDAVGKLSKSKAKSSLADKGKYYSIKLPTKEDVNRLLELNKIIKEKGLKTVIDSVYSKEQFKEAHKKTYSGHKVGNVVIEWKKSKK